MSDSKKQGITAIGKNIKIDASITHVYNDNPLTPEQLKIITEQAIETAVAKIKEATDAEKAELLDIIDKHTNRLANLPQAFKEAQAQIAELKIKLEREGNEIGAEKLAVAITALEKGDFSKADDLFAEIETREKLAIERAARAAFARGEIAEQEVRWKDASKHYIRAAELNPSFDTLIRAQELAHNIGNYDSALSLGMMAKKAAIAEYGEESYQHAVVLHLFGASYHEKGQDKKAEPLYKQAIEINKVKLGKNHPQTALHMGGLAGVYERLGKYKDAEFLFKQCLEIVRGRLGDENTHTASTINNLAGLYKRQGNYTDAKRLYQQALNINMKIFGENHPHTATNINNIADTYTELGKYEEALKLYWQSLNISKKTLGESHPNTAINMGNIARVYVRQGRYKDADPLFEKAVKLLETILGDEHPNTKGVRKNYEENKKRLANT